MNLDLGIIACCFLLVCLVEKYFLTCNVYSALILHSVNYLFVILRLFIYVQLITFFNYTNLKLIYTTFNKLILIKFNQNVRDILGQLR